MRAYLVCAFALALSAPAHASSSCKLVRFAELPVTMSNLRPLISAKINDQEALFLADSGAFFSMMSAASAAEFKLTLSPTPFGFYVTGAGGSTGTSLTTVKAFGLAGATIKNVQFLVGGSEVAQGAVGVLGQNLLRIADVEYDLAHGVIRLIRASDCTGARLAYWATAEQSYSEIEIEHTTGLQPHTIGSAFINGQKIRVMFDSGSQTSIVSLKAAEHAGITPATPGVVDAGFGRGIGHRLVHNYVAPVSSFKIGDEEIRRTHLRVGDIDLEFADMLLGADFFLSHRIFVANSQSKAYFTYNGGPVFNLTAGAVAATDAAVSSPAAPAAPMAQQTDDPVDAAHFSQRGNAFASRHEYQHAIADLTRACELSPDHPEYFYQRAVAYLQNKQPEQAASDLDRVLELKPDQVSALAARAKLRLSRRDTAGGIADLDAADHFAAKEADERLFLADSYERADLLTQAVAQYDLWVAVHQDDARLATALDGRCRSLAFLGEALPKALADCNQALKRSSGSKPLEARALTSRALVRLRMGDYDKSLADFDAALKIEPHNALSLFGRGVAHDREKDVARGDADIVSAQAIAPQIAELFNRHGIVP